MGSLDNSVYQEVDERWIDKIMLYSHENKPIMIFPEIKAQAVSPWPYALKQMMPMELRNPQEHPEIQKG